MLPAPEEVWLPDAAGNRYTCELRMLVVHPVPWRPPGRSSPQAHVAG
jgi:hypothetical protein